MQTQANIRLLTQTYVVKCDQPEDLLQNCSMVGDVSPSKFKNSFVVRIKYGGSTYTIRCCKNGSFVLTGIKNLNTVIYCMGLILQDKQYKCMPSMENVMIKYRLNKSIDYVLEYINSTNTMYAYKLPKSPGINIKIQVSSASVPEYTIAGCNITFVPSSSGTNTVSVSLFNSGIAIFSGKHRICILRAAHVFEKYCLLTGSLISITD
jgi:hypothetical protein